MPAPCSGHCSQVSRPSLVEGLLHVGKERPRSTRSTLCLLLGVGVGILLSKALLPFTHDREGRTPLVEESAMPRARHILQPAMARSLSQPAAKIWQFAQPASVRQFQPPAASAASSSSLAGGLRVAAPRPTSAINSTRRAIASSSSKHATLIFMRHGQSVWNEEGIFTGWVDVDLSQQGVEEAKAGGELLKAEGLMIDVAFTSFLKRAIKTCGLALEVADQLYAPVTKSWRLNERMYGGLTGMNKKQSVMDYGPDQVQVWRRSFDVPPAKLDKDSEWHPVKEAKYRGLDPEDIPDTECLKDVITRVMPYWEENIVPELRKGSTVFVAAHGNSIRAILKFIEGIPDETIPGLEIPTGIPLVYQLDADLKPLPSAAAIAPLKFGYYLGDAAAAKAAAEKVKAQTKVA